MYNGLDELERLLRETLLPSDPQKAPTVMFISTSGCIASIYFKNPKTGLGVAIVPLFMMEEGERVPVGEWALQACRERDDGRAELITARKKMLETQTYAEVREVSYHMKVKVNNHDAVRSEGYSNDCELSQAQSQQTSGSNRNLARSAAIARRKGSPIEAENGCLRQQTENP